MATKPTREQQRACDLFAESLLRIAEGARLDGRGPFDAGDLDEVARRVARASSAFDRETIVARALGRRVQAMGLPEHAAELLTLMEAEVPPLAMLLLRDDEFRALVERMEQELGEG